MAKKCGAGTSDAPGFQTGNTCAVGRSAPATAQAARPESTPRPTASPSGVHPLHVALRNTVARLHAAKGDEGRRAKAEAEMADRAIAAIRKQMAKQGLTEESPEPSSQAEEKPVGVPTSKEKPPSATLAPAPVSERLPRLERRSRLIGRIKAAQSKARDDLAREQADHDQAFIKARRYLKDSGIRLESEEEWDRLVKGFRRMLPDEIAATHARAKVLHARLERLIGGPRDLKTGGYYTGD